MMETVVIPGLPGPFHGGLDSLARRRMIDTLAVRRAQWQRHRPPTYVIRVLSMGCIHVTVLSRGATRHVRDQLVVRDTTIVRHRPVPIHSVYAQRCTLPWRVEDLFTGLARALADSATSVSVEYDIVYGFPRRYSSYRSGSSHDGAEMLVESFAPIP